MNVLEHIADDLSAPNMRAVLASGGNLILLVPAFQFLYGTVDRSLEHYRRYTKRDLLPKNAWTGFQVEKAFYMNFIDGRVVGQQQDIAFMKNPLIKHCDSLIALLRRGPSASKSLCRRPSVYPIAVGRKTNQYSLCYDPSTLQLICFGVLPRSILVPAYLTSN